MRLLATSYGSAGDFLPTVAIAHGLRELGHEVVFVTNAFHERPITRLGFRFVPAGEHFDLYAMITKDPEILQSARGFATLVELLAPFVTANYRVARALLTAERFDAVLGSNLAFGLFWASMERRLPGVMVSATPLFWASARAPAQMLDLELPSWLLGPVAGALRASLMAFADHALCSLAREIGPLAIDPSATAIEEGLALHLGTWSEILRPRHPGDPTTWRACGFASAGGLGAPTAGLSPEIEAFLERGSAPVVVALGSIYSLGSDDVVRGVVEACRELGERCLVVGPGPRGAPLGDDVAATPYAAYDALFPRARGVVIHGGAGTTGEALRAGVPSVVVPFAFDQFGLSWHVERLGTGVRVAKMRRTQTRLRDAIARACEDESLRERAADVRGQLAGAADGGPIGARLVEQALGVAR